MLKCISQYLLSTTSNSLKYSQSINSNLYRPIFTFNHRYASTNVSKSSSIIIKPCNTHEELDECVALQKLVWKQSSLDIMPRRSFLIANKTGGIVLGVYNNHENSRVLLGFVLSLAGILPGKSGGIYWHAEMSGIHPDVRNQHIGQQLFCKLRDYALSRNIKLIKYNFDPTEIRNAHLYINRTGSIGRQYSSNHYGLFSPSRDPVPFAGRLHMECWLDSPHTHRCLGLNTSNINRYGTYKPKIIKEASLPAGMGQWKSTKDKRAIDAYQKLDKHLSEASDQNLSVVGFRKERDGTSVYELGNFDVNDILRCNSFSNNLSYMKKFKNNIHSMLT
ncbi:unnamed protein product [Adineta steineri]|uniref:N-acetyltransferase domain-containing protein n=1 Tax=Adineta steineri TaxID=433720 RepID=A0A819SAP3_9BILA|nr:unnamed protein product [Adineta steineri]